ncbi:hypothetical protein [Abyssisolibacter fermentans]|uniref:hypothetical protein n=1 Tax=Abyssisolibacter fermentans TaxID=1766203 RepID=UPI0012E3AB7C|nr:hypothetical protein [Abyssisolibacter fermentans]
MKPYIKFSIIFSIVIVVAILLNIQSFNSVVNNDNDLEEVNFQSFYSIVIN